MYTLKVGVKIVSKIVSIKEDSFVKIQRTARATECGQ